MEKQRMIGRRQVLQLSALVLTGLAIHGPAFSAERKKEAHEEVSPPEDLMREHGVLRRVLLIYRDFLHRLDTDEELPWQKLSESAIIIRTFIEQYHEKLEENYIFPAMRQAKLLTGLVDILDEQHKAGRRITAVVLEISGKKSKDSDELKTLYRGLNAFIRMYEPHAAREDTVLFPALRSVWNRKEFGRMGDVFEKEEDRLFGEHGFEKMVDRVEAIEKALGIYDLKQFTP